MKNLFPRRRYRAPRPLDPSPAEQAEAAVRAIAADAATLLDAAYGCRAGGLSAVTCAPILKTQFPATPINDFATAFTLAWAGIMTSAMLTQVLTAAPYPSGEIAAAVTAAMQLTWLTNATYTDSSFPLMPKVHALYQGDLTKLTAGEAVDFLVVSCLPGDYTPSPGTLVGALNGIGVSVQQLSQNPAATYAQFNCWISQPIANQKFGQLIVFLSTGADAPAKIPGILQALQAYLPNPHPGTEYPYATIAQPLVSTGSAGGNLTAVMTALFNSAKSVLSGTYHLGCVKTVVFPQSQVGPMTTLFNSLKT